VANFIFTRCQGPCPVISKQMADLQKMFSNNPEIVYISFSVDSDYDTPTILAKYASIFGADNNRWHFLTGDKNDVYSLIRNSFHLAIEPESDTNFIHSLHFVLVDRGNVIKGYYNSSDPDAFKELQKELNKLI
jgi:protein SCO1